MLDQGAVEEVHGRGADEAGDEEVGGMVVEVHGGGHLLDGAVVHHGDALAEGEGLGLVVGDVEHGGAEAGVEAGDFGAHWRRVWASRLERGSSSRSRVGRRTRARPRATRWRWPPERAAGRRSRQGVSSRSCAASRTRLVDFRPGEMPDLQAEGEVVIDRHVGVEGVVLEDHGDVAVLRGQVVDDLAGEGDGARGGLLQAGDEAQGGGLAAARGADQDEEFLVLNDEAGVVHGAKGLAGRAPGRSW